MASIWAKPASDVERFDPRSVVMCAAHVGDDLRADVEWPLLAALRLRTRRGRRIAQKFSRGADLVQRCLRVQG